MGSSFLFVANVRTDDCGGAVDNERRSLLEFPSKRPEDFFEPTPSLRSHLISDVIDRDPCSSGRKDKEQQRLTLLTYHSGWWYGMVYPHFVDTNLARTTILTNRLPPLHRVHCTTITRMKINSNFKLFAATRFDATKYIASPAFGVNRFMLDRIGEEKARATTIVQCKGPHVGIYFVRCLPSLLLLG